MFAGILSRRGNAFLGVMAIATALSTPAFAGSAETTQKAAHDGVPITVTLNNVRAGDVPLYISIQTESEYQSYDGAGGILQSTESGQITETFDVPAAGEYAISIWHDLDNDGRFSMAEGFQLLDGWGTSGTVPFGAPPTFKDAKVSIPSSGDVVEINMIYPKS